MSSSFEVVHPFLARRTTSLSIGVISIRSTHLDEASYPFSWKACGHRCEVSLCDAIACARHETLQRHQKSHPVQTS